MLQSIKQMINQKKAFVEAAELILEDDKIDDAIVLSDNDDENDLDDKPEEKDSPEELSTPEEKHEEEEEDPNDPEANVDHSHEELPDDMTKDQDQNDILNMSLDDDLPTPVGAQTGEPANIGTDDILSTEIDLATNTPIDTLPTPPSGAADAVQSDSIMNMEIPSGFGEDAPTDGGTGDIPDPNPDVPVPNSESSVFDINLDSPVTESYSSPLDDIMNMEITEAISIGDSNDESDGKPADGGNNDNVAPDEGETPDDTQSDNAVTSAVKDKVNEAETNDQPPADDGTDESTGDDSNADSFAGDSTAAATSKEELMKKLSNLTKNIEDIKAEVYGSN